MNNGSTKTGVPPFNNILNSPELERAHPEAHFIKKYDLPGDSGL